MRYLQNQYLLSLMGAGHLVAGVLLSLTNQPTFALIQLGGALVYFAVATIGGERLL